MSRERQISSWKKSFDPDFDPENPSYPPRVDLSTRQKNWIRRMWTWASTAMLGMQEECLPEAIPRYSEEKGWHYVPAVDPNLHHEVAVGESQRIDGTNNYNRPRNVAPLSARLHVGRGVRPGDEDEDEVVHQDTMEGLRWYGVWAKGGRHGKNPIQLTNDERKKKTDRGEIYHNPIHDEQLTDLTKEVVDTYTTLFPEDTWPTQ